MRFNPKFLFALAAFIFGYSNSNAQFVETNKFFELHEFSKSPPKKEQFTVFDPEMNAAIVDAGTGDITFKDKSVDGYVRLFIDPLEHTSSFIPAYSEYRVEMQILYYTVNTTTEAYNAGVPQTKTLTVTYDPDNSKIYNDIHEIHFDDAYKITVKVTEIKDKYGTAYTSYASLPFSIRLESGIKIERYWNFDPSVPAADLEVMYISDSGNPLYKHIGIGHFTIPGAYAYDIEWTYSNDYGTTGDLDDEIDETDIEYIFRNNATRVRVYNNSAIVFPAVNDRGYIIARVRGIGKSNDLLHDVYGVWNITDNYDDGTTAKKKIPDFSSAYPDAFAYMDKTIQHEGNKNWMYQCTYAEEGKMKHIVNYYDGTMRSRQTVTQMNSIGQNDAIIMETFYDHQGRAAVQSLPAPPHRSDVNVSVRTVQYYENFNVSEETDIKYGRVDFDMDNNSSCSATINEFSDASGAGEYYSSSNNLIAKYNAFIPDANGFPFAVTEFTPDNTGRINRQSGVGDMHTLISGHATRYFYAKPFQEELDRLFGTDVGLAEHYQKNAVIDPNGQVSVSYLDMKGNVVATALSGGIPPNVSPLSNVSGTDELHDELQETVTIDLLNITLDHPQGVANIPSSDGYALTVNTPLLVTEESDYEFVYSVPELQYVDDCLNSLCMECIYNLQISLLDQCGNIVSDADGGELFYSAILGETPLLNQPVDAFDCPETIEEFSTDPSLLNVFTIDDLPIGNYTIVKKLSIDTSAIETYAELFINKIIQDEPECFHNEDYYLATLDGCDFDCSVCDDLKEFEDYSEWATAQTGLGFTTETLHEIYDALVSECENLCEGYGNNTCENAYLQMLNDVSPDGQYAQYLSPVTGEASPGLYPVSVLNEGNFLQKRDFVGDNDAPNWRNPTRKLGAVWLHGYFNEDGSERTRVYIYEIAPGVFSPAIIDGAPTYPDATGTYTYPENLADINDFVSAFAGNNSWAKSLVSYHPEYYYYDYCIAQYECTANIGGNPEMNTFEYDEYLLNLNFDDDEDNYIILDLIDMDGSDGVIMKTDPIFASACSPSGLSGFEADTDDDTDIDGTPYDPDEKNKDRKGRYDIPWYKQEMRRRMNEFVLCDGDPLYNLWEYAWIVNHEGLTFGSSLDECTEVDGLPPAFSSLIVTEDDWVTFVTTYISIKEQYLREKMEKSADWNHAYCGCIGTESYDAEEYFGEYDNFKFHELDIFDDLHDDYQSETFEGHVCSFPTAFYLRDKVRRFPNIITDVNADEEDKKKTLDSLLAENDYAYYVATGNMPLTADLQNYLNGELTGGGLVTSYHAITANDNLSQRLYDYLIASPARVFTHWDVSISGSVMTWSSSGSTCDEITFTITTPDLWADWSSVIVSFHDIHTTNSSTGEFILLADVKDGSDIKTMEIEGDVCDDMIDDDDFLIDAIGCKLTPQANAIAWLINMAILDLDFPESTPYTIDNVDLMLGEYSLIEYLGPADYYTFEYDEGTPTIIYIYPEADPDHEKIKVIFDEDINDDYYYLSDLQGVSGETEPSYTPYTVFDFGCWANSETDPQIFTFGSIQWTPDDGSVAYEDLPIAICDYPISDPCNSKEFEYSVFLEEIFDEVVTDESLTSGSPMSISSWPAEFGDFLGFPSAGWQFMGSDEHRLTANFHSSAPFCYIELNFTNPETAYTFEDLDHIINLVADFSLSDPTLDYTYSFTCTGIIDGIEDPIEIPMYGSTTCIPLKACCGQTSSSVGVGGGEEIPGPEEEEDPDLAYKAPCDPTYEPFPTIPEIDYCEVVLASISDYNQQYFFDQYLDSIKKDFKEKYIAHCMGTLEEFSVTYTTSEYQYTLYYYDQAGNLVMTVPPKGVVLIDITDLDDVEDARDANTSYPAVHDLTTAYHYNTLNQLIYQSTPDAGLSKFYYDKLGRLVISQNAKQAITASSERRFSYTVYDKLSRIEEVGELSTIDFSSSDVFDVLDLINDPGAAFNFHDDWATSARDVTYSVYDQPHLTGGDLTTAFGSSGQENLRKRIGAVFLQTAWDADKTLYDHATHYSYDIHGNVKTLVQENPSLAGLGERFKKTVYEFDLISGNVNRVKYQEGDVDQFFHEYSYDADNRLYEVYTSRDNMIQEREARYYYYRHGPLARVEMGDHMVQGVDYGYTIHGWLKGVNASALNTSRDIGNDAKSGYDQYVGADAYGFVLDYYDGDYSMIKTSGTTWIASATSTDYGIATPDLFNGNIRAMSTQFMLPATTSGGTQDKSDVLGKVYRYDQLNRLTESKGYLAEEMDEGGKFTWAYASVDTTNNWETNYTYDPNGNIITMNRNGQWGASSKLHMDDFEYTYNSGTNQLNYVDDNSAWNSYYSEDVDQQSTDNYLYDAIGNLIADVKEGIDAITWSVYGKITKIDFSGGSGKADIEFAYDATGNRIMKKVAANGGNPLTYTYYVRDAQGNIMVTYFRKVTSGGGGTDSIFASEQHIYGSSRLGYVNLPTKKGDMTKTLSSSNEFKRYLGEKRYELANHLGNVLVVVSDRRKTFQDGTSGDIKNYEADVQAVQDYDPFGMMLVGRNWEVASIENYEFGYQSSLQDDEIYGNGNSYSTAFRENDPRLGKWWSFDPKTKETPWESPYSSMGNNPICMNDILGDKIPLSGKAENQNTLISQLNEVTGGKYKVNRKGELKAKFGNYGKTVTGQLFKEAIKSKNIIPIKAVSNDDTFFDDYRLTTVDVGDLSLAEPALMTGVYAHFISERLAAGDRYANASLRYADMHSITLGGISASPKFDAYHKIGLKYESLAIGENLNISNFPLRTDVVLNSSDFRGAIFNTGVKFKYGTVLEYTVNLPKQYLFFPVNPLSKPIISITK